MQAHHIVDRTDKKVQVYTLSFSCYNRPVFQVGVRAGPCVAQGRSERPQGPVRPAGSPVQHKNLRAYSRSPSTPPERIFFQRPKSRLRRLAVGRTCGCSPPCCVTAPAGASRRNRRRRLLAPGKNLAIQQVFCEADVPEGLRDFLPCRTKKYPSIRRTWRS